MLGPRFPEVPFMPGPVRNSVAELAARVPDGASVLLPKGEGPDLPMALVRELVRRRPAGLRLVTLPTCAQMVSGMAADMLIGAGCVAEVETSGISLGELGVAPRFNAAARAGRVRVIEATCPAIYAAVQAGAKGQPFASLRGLIGSDVLAGRDDYTVIDNPFAPGDPVAVLKALNPDFALFHARAADRDGNVWIGRQRDLLIAAHAAETVLVTVDEVRDCDFFEDEAIVAGVIPSFYIDALAEAPGGALPMHADARVDIDTVRRYAEEARTEAGFAAWLEAEGLRQALPAAE